MDKEYTLRLREIRKSKKLTQGELASMIGATERIVGCWEREDTALSLSDAVECARALGCTPNDLCGWDDGAPGAARPLDDPLRAAVVDSFDSMNGEGRSTLADVARGLASLPANRPGDECPPLPAQGVA